jgi:hypothetical protein
MKIDKKREEAHKLFDKLLFYFMGIKFNINNLSEKELNELIKELKWGVKNIEGFYAEQNPKKK